MYFLSCEEIKTIIIVIIMFTDFLFLLELVEIEIKTLAWGDMNEQNSFHFTWVWLARDNLSFACLLVTLALHARCKFEEKNWQKKVKNKNVYGQKYMSRSFGHSWCVSWRLCCLGVTISPE